MTFLNQLDTIDAQLNRVLQVNKHLRASGTMTHLESDLIREYLRRLYEMYDALEEARPSMVSKPQPTPEKTAPVEVAPPAEQKVSPPEEPKKAEEVSVDPEPVKTAEVVKPAPDPVTPPPVAAPSPSAAETAVEEETTVEEEESINLFDKYRKTGAVKEVNAKGASAKSLKELIPLNDKFMFIREFFGNSISRYDEALKELETLGNRQSIMNYLEQQVFTPEVLTKQEELVQRFTDIIERKYGA